MKSLFLLVVLLPLCHSSNLTFPSAREIILKLIALNHLYKDNKVNITSWDNVNVPSMDMLENASDCVNVFKKELKHLLKNLTVVEETDLIKGITKNLDLLQTTEQEEDERCTMDRLSPKAKKPFQQYINFLRKLYSKPARG